MSTSVERAADADDGVQNLVVSDPVIGEWIDSYTNDYVVTGGSNGKYSVTVTYKQDGKRRGQQRDWGDIITLDASGVYLWGSTHKLCILENGCVDWQPLNPQKKHWRWKRKIRPHVFSPTETSLNVPMSELQKRLRVCLGSTLSHEQVSPTIAHSFVSPLDPSSF